MAAADYGAALAVGAFGVAKNVIDEYAGRARRVKLQVSLQFGVRLSGYGRVRVWAAPRAARPLSLGEKRGTSSQK